MGTLEERAPARVSRFSAKVNKVRWGRVPRRLLEQKGVIEWVCLKYKIGGDTFQKTWRRANLCEYLITFTITT